MESANPQTIKINRWFLLWWMLANMVGLPTLVIPLIAGLYIAVMLVIGGDQALNSTGYFFVGTIVALIGLFLGGCLGLLQWLVLRQYMQIGANWIWTTAVGVAIGSLMCGIVYVGILSGSIIDNLDGIGFLLAQGLVVFGIVNGIAIGVTQWIVLRRAVLKAWLWVIMLPTCFTLGVLLASLVQLYYIYTILSYDPMGGTQFSTVVAKMEDISFLNIILPLLALIIMGLVTGGLLSWLFRRNKKVML